MKRFLTLIATIIITLSNLFAQNTDKTRYQTTRITNPPHIDGILDDKAWENGEWAGDFSQFEPYNGRTASQRTEFKILFDENNIYVAIRAFDTAPDSIVRRLTRRDEVDGDLVGVAFDSYHDLRTGFVFGVSAGGVKFDMMMTNNGQNEDDSWNPNYWAKATVNEEGWVAEMKIPFSQLRFEKNSDDVWGFQVYRQLYRYNEMSFWEHIPQDAPGLIHLFGEISGFENIKPRKIFDITPYGVASLDNYEAQPGNPFAAGRDYRLNGGLDAKIGVTNNLTLDLTINPDFGQVEADPSEVNLTAYETYFEEKRPFFVEGKNITDFNIGLGDGGIGNDNLFYSRRIGRRPQGYPSLGDNQFANIPRAAKILTAAKLTGKTKSGLSLGFIETVTAEEKAEIDTEGTRTFETVEPLTNYFVGRVQKDNDNGNTIIGGMFTSVNRQLTDNLENSLHKAAYSGGIDFTKFFREKTWMFNLNASVSHVAGSELAIVRTQRSSARYFQRPDATHFDLDSSKTSLTGTGGRMQIVKSGNSHWTFMAAMVWKSPEFEINDIGYMREADNIIQVAYIGYRQWEPKGIYRNYNINLNQYSAWTLGGEHMVDGLNMSGNITFKNFWYANAGGELNFNSKSNAMLRGGPMMNMPASLNSWYNAGTDSRKKLVFRVSGGLNKGFSGSSSSSRIGAGMTYKPVNTLVVSVNPSYSVSSNQLQYIGRRSFEDENRYLFGSIKQKVLSASLRVNFNLTPELTLQYWGQPFMATGSYADFKKITNPVAGQYDDRFSVYPESAIELIDNSYYAVDENLNGTADYSFDKPDFNLQEFLSNLVIRWEYNPGSTIFLVWSQTRSNFDDEALFDPRENIGDLFGVKPYDVFLIKFSYRFGVK
ncbi:MAG: DUF5916 domain-containing protein [Bacteroidales bacterium]